MSDHGVGGTGPMPEGDCDPMASQLSERRTGAAATGVSR